LSVREAEKLVQAHGQQPEQVKQKKEAKINRDTERLQEEMSAYLGARVEIKSGSKGKGKLVIEYMNHDQLDDLLNKLKKA
ncbi:MAG TPA: chromosome partitioning protein ParB, partial [Gallionella sp.]|nr:chromosome partitioning protein ParB [Gallionella sp.]